MEHLPVKLNEPDLFDITVHGQDGVRTLMDAGDLQIITKDNGTHSGRALACLTFTVDVDGKPVRVQTVTTVRLLTSAFAILRGRYGEDGKAAS